MQLGVQQHPLAGLVGADAELHIRGERQHDFAMQQLYVCTTRPLVLVERNFTVSLASVALRKSFANILGGGRFMFIVIPDLFLYELLSVSIPRSFWQLLADCP